jgi:hypothetical protein
MRRALNYFLETAPSIASTTAWAISRYWPRQRLDFAYLSVSSLPDRAELFLA